jgi:hypothetical protein
VKKLIAPSLAFGLMPLGLAAPALVTDGVIEINQAKVMANSGFPFTIAPPGSYRLTSNPTVTETNKNAINVNNAGNVTIDLNGCGIQGPGGTAVVLSGSPSCSTTTTTYGAAESYPVTASQETLAAANGSFASVGTLAVVAPSTVILTSNSVLSKAAGGYQARITIT